MTTEGEIFVDATTEAVEFYSIFRLNENEVKS